MSVYTVLCSGHHFVTIDCLNPSMNNSTFYKDYPVHRTSINQTLVSKVNRPGTKCNSLVGSNYI